MVAALPAQEELIFCFHSCAQARPHCACQQHSDPNFSRGYLYSVGATAINTAAAIHQRRSGRSDPDESRCFQNLQFLSDGLDQHCRGGDKLVRGRSSSKTSPPDPLAISWEAGGL
jgi:hypothetical protein